MSDTADVVVLGGGVVGASTAFHLASTRRRAYRAVRACARMADGRRGRRRVGTRFRVCRHPDWSSTLVGAASRRLVLNAPDALDEGVDADYVGRAREELAKRIPPKLLDPRPFRVQRFADNEPIIGEYEYGDRDTEYARAQKVMLG